MTTGVRMVTTTYILDGRYLYTRPLVVHYKMGHLGQEAVMNKLRQRYWIVGIRAVVKKTCGFSANIAKVDERWCNHRRWDK
jgi:hypothetical protein